MKQVTRPYGELVKLGFTSSSLKANKLGLFPHSLVLISLSIYWLLGLVACNTAKEHWEVVTVELRYPLRAFKIHNLVMSDTFLFSCCLLHLF